MPVVTKSFLDSYLEKSIADICDCGCFEQASSLAKHYAHFLAHLLGLSHGTTCDKLTISTAKGTAASVYATDVLRQSAILPYKAEDGCLYFGVQDGTDPRKFTTGACAESDIKVVGIYLNGFIYFYRQGKHSPGFECNSLKNISPSSHFFADFPSSARAIWK